MLRKRFLNTRAYTHEFDEESGHRVTVYHRKIGAICVVLVLLCIWCMVAKISAKSEYHACCDDLKRDIYRFIGSNSFEHVHQRHPCHCDDDIDERVKRKFIEKMMQSHEELSSQCVTAFEFGIPICVASYQTTPGDAPTAIIAPRIDDISSETYTITEEYNVFHDDQKHTVVQQKQRPYTATLSYDTLTGHVASKRAVGAFCHCAVFLHDMCSNKTARMN
jgi:hypothetical protein